MRNIGIVIYDGFDELDAIGPFEVFRNAAADGFKVRLVALGGARRVTASHGLAVEADGDLSDGFALLLVAGGAWAARGKQGAWAEIQRGELPLALARLRGHGLPMASVCTGAMILSAAGITRDRPATTHRVALSSLASESARLVEARVVDDGDLVTCGGVTSGIDLALWIVQREAGPARAEAIAAQMEHDRRWPVWSQGVFVDPKAAPLFAPTPAPPYYAVVFTRRRTPGDRGYADTADRMAALAEQQPGFLGYESVAATDGHGITVSYWENEAAIAAWRTQVDHLAAQAQGKTAWYADYRVRVARVERAYGSPNRR